MIRNSLPKTKKTRLCQPARERGKQTNVARATVVVVAASLFSHDKILQSVPRGCYKAQDILDKSAGNTLHHDTPRDPLGPEWIRIEFGDEPALASAKQVGKQTIDRAEPSERVWTSHRSDGANEALQLKWTQP